MIKNNDNFGLITNKIFYGLDDKIDSSILKEFKFDGKVLLMLYEFWMLKNMRNKVILNLEYLIKSLGYKWHDKTKKSIEEILFKLREMQIIDFTVDKIKKDTLLEIDITNLLDEDDGYFNFFKISDEEIDLIRSESKDNRNFITDLKVYCYLKARVKKIDKDKNIAERGYGESETTWRSFEDITKHTGVSSVEKSITNLKKIGLIDYVNAGSKRKKSKYNNVYALTRVSKDVKLELKEGLKQYIYWEKNKKTKILNKKVLTNKN